MTKRQVRPHKGGRTAKLTVRMTPEIRQKINDIKDETGISQGDILEGLVSAEWEKLFCSQEVMAKAQATKDKLAQIAKDLRHIADEVEVIKSDK